MSKRLSRRLIAAFFICLFLPFAVPDEGRQARFDPARYLEHVRYLASDELQGRGTGTPGAALAAEYIARQLEAAGCRPAGSDGSWFQPFEVTSGKKLIDEKALLVFDTLSEKLVVRRDWIPLPFTEMRDVEAPVAFAGYGIEAPGFNYDDYAGFDASGKALLVLRYEPKAEDPQAEFGGTEPSEHALFWNKARVAARHGAAALIIVNPPNRDPAEDELYAWDPFATGQTYPLPMVHIRRSVAELLLGKAGLADLDTLTRQLDQTRKPQSQDLGFSLRLRIGVEPNRLAARNVVGLLPGDGTTGETIVIGAHYDHLGVRPSRRGPDVTPQIHNGADDNASGAAGLLELARVLGRRAPLRRNLLFVAFDGEELGLCGSRYFVEHPAVELSQIRAMINLDMIGRLNAGKFTLYGINTAREFAGLVEQAALQAGLQYRVGRGSGAGASDQASFLRRQIPVLFAFTGVHKEYHTPEDDWQLIDAEGAVSVLKLCERVTVELASAVEGPTFVPPTGEPEEEPVRPAVDEDRAEDSGQGVAATRPARDADSQPTRLTMKVRLGIVPDMVGDGEPGLVVEEVLDGSCAKAAGIQNGDRILRIGQDDVRDIYAYMRILSAFRPGDEVDVVVLRKGERKTFRVKLQASNYRREE
jgi:hypothetical protein